MTRQDSTAKRRHALDWSVAEDDDTWQELTRKDEEDSGAVDAPESRALNQQWVWMTAVCALALVVLFSGYLHLQAQPGQVQVEPEVAEVVDSDQDTASDASDATELSTFNPEPGLSWQYPSGREGTARHDWQSAASTASGYGPSSSYTSYGPFELFVDDMASGDGECNRSDSDSRERRTLSDFPD